MQLIPTKDINILLDEKIEEILNGKNYDSIYDETKKEIKSLLK